MRTELLLLSNKLARLLVRQNFSGLDFSIHVVVSTYTNTSVTKGFRVFYGSENKTLRVCEGVGLMQL